MNDDNVGPLGVDTDRAFGAMNQLLDFVVGFLVNIHLFQLSCCQYFTVRPEQLIDRHHAFNCSSMVRLVGLHGTTTLRNTLSAVEGWA